MEWRNTDPRTYLCDHLFSTIVIVRPARGGRWYLESGVGLVETKHDYAIHTPFAEHGKIDAASEWDPNWWWIGFP